MIVYWPGKTVHSHRNALISQVDVYASLASLVNQPLANEDAIDSLDMMSALPDYTIYGAVLAEFRHWLISNNEQLYCAKEEVSNVSDQF